MSRLVTFNNDDRDAAFAAEKDIGEKDAKWLREEEELLSFVLKRDVVRYIDTGRTRMFFFLFLSSFPLPERGASRHLRDIQDAFVLKGN